MKKKAYWLMATMWMTLGACIAVSAITLVTGIAPLAGTPSPVWHGVVGVTLPAAAIIAFATKRKAPMVR